MQLTCVKEKILLGFCQNIEHSRAAVHPEMFSEHFTKLELPVHGVSARHIKNYEEINYEDQSIIKILGETGSNCCYEFI